ARIAARGGAKGVGVPLGVSIGKSRAVGLDPIDGAIADYVASFREARRVADFVVVNVSSPNTKDLRAMQGSEIARALFAALAREGADLVQLYTGFIYGGPLLPHAIARDLVKRMDARGAKSLAELARV